MVTDTQQAITTGHPGARVITRAAEQFRQFICGLHGHDALLHFEEGRMSLQCTSCGYETPGWDLRANEEPEAATPVQAPRVVQLPLAHERRVA